MGQVLHGSATTTEAVRPALQHGQESQRALAKRHGINPKTVAKWCQRTSTTDERTGPKEARSTVLSLEEEAAIKAFRRHTLLPQGDCRHTLQATIPRLTRSSRHRCLQRPVDCVDIPPSGSGHRPMASGACRTSKGRRSRRRSSRPTRSASSTSTSPLVQTAQGRLYLLVASSRSRRLLRQQRCGRQQPAEATARPSLPWSNSIARQPKASLPTSCDALSKPFPIRCTPSPERSAGGMPGSAGLADGQWHARHRPHWRRLDAQGHQGDASGGHSLPLPCLRGGVRRSGHPAPADQAVASPSAGCCRPSLTGTDRWRCHRWTNGQVERMNRTIKDATVKRYHDDEHAQLERHLTDFIAAYNFGRRLKTLKGLTP
jgi:hypothetical protein